MMGFRGLAMMGVGSALGEDRAKNAAMAAISSPLLEDISINGAQGILVNVVAPSDLGSDEFEEVGHLIESFAHPDAMIKIGLAFDDNLVDEVQVTIIATGLTAVGQAAKVEAKSEPVVAPVQPEPTTGRGRTWAPLSPAGLTPSVANGAAKGVPGMVPSNIAGLRQGAAGVIGASHNESAAYLNIPSFIRRQAD
jgi:cell division protein FtsZ